MDPETPSTSVTPHKRPRRKKHRGLTHVQGGPAAHNASVRAARNLKQKLKRQAEAWELHCQGLTYDQIGPRLHPPVSGPTAWHIVQDHADLIRKHAVSDVDITRARVQRGLDHVKRKTWNKADRPTFAGLLLRALDQEAKLHGAERPKKGEGVTPEQLAGALAQFFVQLERDFPAPEDRAKLVRAAQRALPGIIDVTPEKEDT